MDFAVELVLVFVLLTDMTLLGLGRLAQHSLSAMQGMALGVLPLLVADPARLRPGCLSLLAGMCHSWSQRFRLSRLLSRALRMADVRHEVEPIVGYLGIDPDRES